SPSARYASIPSRSPGCLATRTGRPVTAPRGTLGSCRRARRSLGAFISVLRNASPDIRGPLGTGETGSVAAGRERVGEKLRPALDPAAAVIELRDLDHARVRMAARERCDDRQRDVGVATPDEVELLDRWREGGRECWVERAAEGTVIACSRPLVGGP